MDATPALRLMLLRAVAATVSMEVFLNFYATTNSMRKVSYRLSVKNFGSIILVVISMVQSRKISSSFLAARNINIFGRMPHQCDVRCRRELKGMATSRDA